MISVTILSRIFIICILFDYFFKVFLLLAQSQIQADLHFTAGCPCITADVTNNSFFTVFICFVCS